MATKRSSLSAYGRRIAVSVCSKRPSTTIIGTSPTPSNGAGRVSVNGCSHLASRYSASVIASTSSPVKESTTCGIIPRVFSLDHALTRSASSGPVSSVRAGPGA